MTCFLLMRSASHPMSSRPAILKPNTSESTPAASLCVKCRSRLKKSFRFCCVPLTAAIESEADTLHDIVAEMRKTTTSERQGRLIDSDEASSMEKKKREGYF